MANRKRPSGKIGTFKDILLKNGIASTVRVEKGTDIDAGCCQLREHALAMPSPLALLLSV